MDRRTGWGWGWCGIVMLGFAPVAYAQPGADAWASLGAGYYDGQDYDAPAGQPKTQAQKTGGWEVYAALTAGTRVAARLRANWLTDYTNNTTPPRKWRAKSAWRSARRGLTPSPASAG